MIFLTLVVVPVERRVEDPKLRYELVNKIGTRFKYLGWASIAVLLVTGLYNALQKVTLESLFTTSYGKTLVLKLLLVLIMLALSALHDFYLGPRLVERGKEKGQVMRLARFLTVLARGNLFLGLLVMLLAVTLRSGGVL